MENLDLNVEDKLYDGVLEFEIHGNIFGKRKWVVKNRGNVIRKFDFNLETRGKRKLKFDFED